MSSDCPRPPILEWLAARHSELADTLGALWKYHADKVKLGLASQVPRPDKQDPGRRDAWDVIRDVQLQERDIRTVGLAMFVT